MSKADSTHLGGGFSSLECQPWIRATSTGPTVSYQTAKGWHQPPPAASTGCRHTADFKAERIFTTLTTLQTSYISALYGTLHPNNSLCPAEDLKHIKMCFTHVAKQHKWADSKQQVLLKEERWQLVACGGASLFHQPSATPCMCFPTSQGPSPSMQMVKHGKEQDCQYLLTIAFFPNRVLGVCLFLIWSLKAGKELAQQKMKQKPKAKQQQKTYPGDMKHIYQRIMMLSYRR